MAAKQMSGVLRTYIAAGKATPSPPLGPSLGQVKIFFAIVSSSFYLQELWKNYFSVLIGFL